MSAIGSNQQKFDTIAADTVANCGDLFAATEPAKLRKSKDFD
jgi:hypothetical protein